MRRSRPRRWRRLQAARLERWRRLARSLRHNGLFVLAPVGAGARWAGQVERGTRNYLRQEGLL
jgi:hypothetical protein